MRRLRVLLLFAAAACSHGSSADAPRTKALFDTSADLSSPDHFFDMPYPSDARVRATGAPDLTGLANPIQSAILEGLRTVAMDRRGHPVLPVAYARFTAPVAAQEPTKTIPADASSPILLIDLDANAALIPTVAQTLPPDAYLPEGVLAVAPRPGFVLAPAHTHAAVILKKLGDAQGRPLDAPAQFAELQQNPAHPLAATYAKLWPALDKLGISRADVAVATVFTTEDIVRETSDISTRVLAAYKIDITQLRVDPDDGAAHERYCELQGQVTYPQFQSGVPPYDTDGLIHSAPGSTEAPAKTRDETAPVTISLPKQPMPANGYPLVVYFHGTGGVSDAIADRGVWHYETDPAKCPGGEMDTWNGKTGCNTKGLGPAHVVAEHGIGMAASALPLNPQRFPAGAHKDLPEYFNINNVASLRDIFRQGVFEQRLFIDALSRLRVDPSIVATCTGMSLPPGETAFRFRDDMVLAQGQSMGAMYANMVSAVEPRIRATVATGAGGYWTYFILQTSFIANLSGKLGLLLGLHDAYTYLHPAMMLAQTALEPADPMVFMPRVAKNPLPQHPVRPVYQPVGKGDSYFPSSVQDAAAVAYAHPEAGDKVWASMQEALALASLGGVRAYPVRAADAPAGAVVQYEGDGVYDPHAIYSQLDAVKYQYGCFFASVAATGHATIPAPAPLGTPCPM